MLGLKWDHNNDTLVVSRCTSSTVAKSLTQGLVLSLVSKVFDSMGLVESFTVGAQLSLKDIWGVSAGSTGMKNCQKTLLKGSSNGVLNYLSLPKSLYREATFPEILKS